MLRARAALARAPVPAAARARGPVRACAQAARARRGHAEAARALELLERRCCDERDDRGRAPRRRGCFGGRDGVERVDGGCGRGATPGRARAGVGV